MRYSGDIEYSIQNTVCRTAWPAKSSRSAALPDLPADDKAAQAVAAEMRDLAKEFEEVVSSRQQITTAQAALKEQLDRLNEEFGGISQELKLGSTGAAMGHSECSVSPF